MQGKVLTCPWGELGGAGLLLLMVRASHGDSAGMGGLDHTGLPSRLVQAALKVARQIVLLSAVVQAEMDLSRLRSLMKGAGGRAGPLPFDTNMST